MRSSVLDAHQTVRAAHHAELAPDGYRIPEGGVRGAARPQDRTLGDAVDLHPVLQALRCRAHGIDDVVFIVGLGERKVVLGIVRDAIIVHNGK